MLFSQLFLSMFLFLIIGAGTFCIATFCHKFSIFILIFLIFKKKMEMIWMFIILVFYFSREKWHQFKLILSIFFLQNIWFDCFLKIVVQFKRLLMTFSSCLKNPWNKIYFKITILCFFQIFFVCLDILFCFFLYFLFSSNFLTLLLALFTWDLSVKSSFLLLFFFSKVCQPDFFILCCVFFVHVWRFFCISLFFVLVKLYFSL